MTDLGLINQKLYKSLHITLLWKKSNHNWWCADKLIEIKKTLITESLLRCLAESNRSTWFCRPLPNLPAQAPFLSQIIIAICECKDNQLIRFNQTI